jgi:hypothetical protein
MFYSKYLLFDEGMEIMVPAYLEKKASMISEHYLWESADKKTSISVSRGEQGIEEADIAKRLDEYYLYFRKNTSGFKNKLTKTHKIYGSTYGQLRYYSKIGDYDFLNIFLLGEYEGREIIFSIQQCLNDEAVYKMTVFEIIWESLRPLKKQPMMISSDASCMGDNISLDLAYRGKQRSIVINVDKDGFVLGGDVDKADCVIPKAVSRAVSRKHCLFTRISDRYFVQDLDSSNYTLVNGVMIPPYELMELENEDLLTIADIDFRVTITKNI